MHVASAMSACPSMHLQQKQPAAASQDVLACKPSCLFPNLACHHRPTSVSCVVKKKNLCPAAKTDIVLALAVSSVSNAIVLVDSFISISDLYLACIVNNYFPLILCFNSRNFIVYIYTPTS
jgi:hypothetical protein